LRGSAAAGVRHCVAKSYNTEIMLQTLNQVLRES
jgi:hypothetical protein